MKIPKCIMVIDNNVTDNWIAERIFKTYNIASEYRFTNNENAIDSLNDYCLINGKFPDLLMVDILYNREKGFGLIDRIRNHSGYRENETRIALLTSVVDYTLNYEKIGKQNIEHVFIKPLDIQQLKNLFI
ncbi:response regulator [Sporocytophaga myxococcoides]|nr:response regulator [Sporocytophaga myxococcoides]